MAINAEELNASLTRFVTTTLGIQGAALVTPDGLPLASSLPNNSDEDRAAAMAAAMLALGERIGNELARGSVDRIFIEGDAGFSLLTRCTNDSVLLVLASTSVKQGLLMYEVRQLVEDLRRSLRRASGFAPAHASGESASRLQARA